MKRYTTAELQAAVKEGARIARARWEDAVKYDAELRRQPVDLPDAPEKMDLTLLGDWWQPHTIPEE